MGSQNKHMLDFTVGPKRTATFALEVPILYFLLSVLWFLSVSSQAALR